MSPQSQETRILLVDDEVAITSFLEMGLQAEGYLTKTCHNGIDAIAVATDFKPHLVILDVMMPGLDGYEVCLALRKSIQTSILMLTAKDEVDDKVKGFDLGADDYVSKPFSFKELTSRIRARLRNQNPELSGVRVIGPFEMEDAKHEIRQAGLALALSPTEYELLRYLLLNHGIVVSKQLILDKVWGYDFIGDDNIVEVYIRYLREKIGDSQRQIIRTIRGAGYRVDL